MLIANAIIILTTSELISLTLDIKQHIPRILSTFLFAFSNVVITCTIAGLVYQLDNPYVLSAFHYLFLLLALAICIRNKKLHIKNPFKNISLYRDFFFNNYDLLLFFLVILLSLVFQLILIYIMPPNTHDSLTTHLSRIGYWLQNKTYFPFLIHNIRDVYYPMNPAFQVLWTNIFNGNDAFVEISQFIAMLTCAISVYGISRVLDRSKKSALLNALLFLSYPIVLMQGTTTQTDLVVASLISCAFYFLFIGFKKDQFKYLALSTLGLSLALGSKQTAFFILPGYFITFFILWWKKRKTSPKLILSFILVTLVFFLFFGSTTYIENIIYFKGFFGPPGSVKNQIKIHNFHNIFEIFKHNSLRLTYSAIDPSGLIAPIKNYFIKSKAFIFSKLEDVLHLDLEAGSWVSSGHEFNLLSIPHLTEDETWYGPIGFFLMLIALITGIYRSIKKKDATCSGLFLTFIIYSFCIIVFRPGWDPYQGRYFLSLAVLITPMIDMYFSKKKVIQVLRSMTILAAISIIITTHLFNEGKPATISENNSPLNRETIWNLDRLDKMTIQNKGLRDPLRFMISQIPPDATVGLCVDTGTWDYPFFREDFSQKLIPIMPKELLLDKDWLVENEIDLVVVNLPRTIVFQDPPDFLSLVYEFEEQKLYRVDH